MVIFFLLCLILAKKKGQRNEKEKGKRNEKKKKLGRNEKERGRERKYSYLMNRE